MNGRLYDPVIGRFLSADPFVQAPQNPQDLNRYSYCLNNPLGFTDSSGYFLDGVGNMLGGMYDCMKSLLSNEYVHLAINILLGAAAMTNPVIGGPVFTAFLYTSTYNGAIALMNGADVSTILCMTTINFLTIDAWHVTGGFLAGIGHSLGADVGTAATGTVAIDWGTKILVHGLVGGGLADIEGANFKDGFIAGVAGEIADCSFDNNQDAMSVRIIVGRTLTAGLVAGVEDAESGGSFINAAKSASFAELYNGCGTAMMMIMAFGNHSQQEQAFAIQKDMFEHPEEYYDAPLTVASVDTGVTTIDWAFNAAKFSWMLRNKVEDLPEYVKEILNYIRKNDVAPEGYKGGKVYRNSGASGGEVLPRVDVDDNPISYREWDVHPFTGANRGAERIVTGSDGSNWFTRDHYFSFMKF